jgi:Subtilase family
MGAPPPLAHLTPLGAEAVGLESTAVPAALPTAEHTTLTPDTAIEHMYALDKRVTTKHSCAKPLYTGGPVCDALIRTDVAPVRADAMSPDETPSGFGPTDLQSAYNLASAAAADGTGETVAVMEGADDPNLESDLATYRAQFGLSACTTADGCFRKVNGSGQQGDYPPADSGWGGEASLDVDMVSAICPNCHILVVESEDLEGAQDVAVSLGAKFISNSWGTADDSGDASADADFDHAGVVDVASSGDSGFGVSFPASSRYVVAAGGTSLTRDSSTARGWSETAWSGAGAGCSSWETKPAWQTDSGCSNRTVADVSADADPGTGVAFYDTFGQGGWGVVGGTSVASPIIASVFALAGAPSTSNPAASVLYAHAGALNDITSGSDGTCSTSYLCTAGPGYDGPTGLGTPTGWARSTAVDPVAADLAAVDPVAARVQVRPEALARLVAQVRPAVPVPVPVPALALARDPGPRARWCPGSPRACAWTTDPRAPPPATRSRSGDATAPVPSSGPADPTDRSSTRNQVSVSMIPAPARHGARSWRSGPATAAPFRSGHSAESNWLDRA